MTGAADQPHLDVARTLANPTRWAIFELLSAGDSLTSTKIAPALGLSPSAVSYHMRELHRRGLVERADDEDDGRERHWRAKHQELTLPEMPEPSGDIASKTIESVRRDLDRMQRLASESATTAESASSGPNLMDVHYVVATASQARALALAIRRVVAIVLPPDRSLGVPQEEADPTATYRVSILFNEIDPPG